MVDFGLTPIHTKSLKRDVTVTIVLVSKKQNKDLHVTTCIWIFQLITCNVKTTWWLWKRMYSTIATATAAQTRPTGNRLSWSDKCMARYMAYIYQSVSLALFVKIVVSIFEPRMNATWAKAAFKLRKDTESGNIWLACLGNTFCKTKSYFLIWLNFWGLK